MMLWDFDDLDRLFGVASHLSLVASCNFSKDMFFIAWFFKVTPLSINSRSLNPNFGVN